MRTVFGENFKEFQKPYDYISEEETIEEEKNIHDLLQGLAHVLEKTCSTMQTDAVQGWEIERLNRQTECFNSQWQSLEALRERRRRSRAWEAENKNFKKE